ncbi:MAG: ApaG protein [Myxococcota bacterium]|jgi:ApaG protein
MSEAISQGVRVHVQPRFHPERSDPAESYWFFSYTVTIENTGVDPVQLIDRHWVITDASGEERHVRGPGVVGEQPELAPGQSFRYTSFCPLKTSLGAMHGTFGMLNADGDRFDAAVAPFSLADPATLN